MHTTFIVLSTHIHVYRLMFLYRVHLTYAGIVSSVEIAHIRTSCYIILPKMTNMMCRVTSQWHRCVCKSVLCTCATLYFVY